ncbi:MAG: winged helix-turn-helix domain-containing protein [Candidatus Helarchaeota archaeon]
MIDQMKLTSPSRSILEFKQILSIFLEYIVLKRYEDEREHTLDDLQCYSAWILNLTPKELTTQISSKRETVLANRVRGMAYRLKRKGLLKSPSKGVYKITSKGLASLKNM